MQSVSDDIKQLVDSYAKVTLAVYIDGQKLVTGIGEASYSAACAGDDEFSFGNACAASMNITLAASLTVAKESLFKVTWSVDETEFPLFTGKVKNAKTSAGRTSVEAWDDMYYAGSDSFVAPSDLLTDCDAAAAWTAVASAMGVEPELATLTMLDGITITGGFADIASDATNSAVAGHIAGLVGGNALMTRAGLLAIRQYTAVDWRTEPYSGGANAESEDFAVTGITLQREEADSTNSGQTETSEYSAGDGSLLLANPLADQAAADRAYASLQTLSFRPGDYAFPGGLLLEPGDVFKVVSMDGTYDVAIGSISFSFDGGVRASVSSGGAEDGGGSPGNINQTLKALFSKTTDLEGRYAQLRQTAGKVAVEVGDDEGVLETVIDTKNWKATYTDSEGNVISGLHFDFVNKRFVLNAAGRFIGLDSGNYMEIVGDSIVLYNKVGIPVLELGYRSLNDPSLPVDLGHSGYLKFNAISVDYPDSDFENGVHSIFRSSVFMQFSNGVWIGNDKYTFGALFGNFAATSESNGIFIDDYNHTVTLYKDGNRQDLYTGEAIAKFA